MYNLLQIKNTFKSLKCFPVASGGQYFLFAQKVLDERVPQEGAFYKPPSLGTPLLNQVVVPRITDGGWLRERRPAEKERKQFDVLGMESRVMGRETLPLVV